jgi:hypothetical protein
MAYNVLRLEASESFAILDEERNALMIEDLEYLDSGCDENGMWHARVTATSQGVNCCGYGCGPTKDWAKIHASNGALYCIYQGRAGRLSNGPSSQNSPVPPTSGSPASASNSIATTTCENCSNVPNITAAMEENSRLRSKYAGLEEDLEQVRRAVLTAQDEKTLALTTITQLQQQIRDQNTILWNAFMHSREQDARLVQLERQLEVAEWSRNVAVKGNRLPVQILQRDLEQLRVADADGTAALRAIIENHELKALSHEGQVFDLESTIRSLETQVIDLTAQAEQFRDERKENDEAVRTVLRDQDRLVIQSLRKENENLKAKVELLSEEQKTSKRVIRGLNQEILKPCYRCRWLKHAFSERKNSDSKAVAKAAELEAVIEQMREVIVEHEARIASQEEELRNRDLELESLEDKLREIGKECNELPELEITKREDWTVEELEELNASYDGDVSDHFVDDDIFYFYPNSAKKRGVRSHRQDTADPLGWVVIETRGIKEDHVKGNNLFGS